jgi:hypothetical protein
MESKELADADGESPDDSDRIKDFCSRHGGPGAMSPCKGDTLPGISGWTEVYAADGYVLRCDWSRSGGLREMQYTERPPTR